MNQSERIAQESFLALQLALREGKPPEPVVLSAHRRFGQACAENWWTAFATDPDVYGVHMTKRQALRQQVDVVGPSNNLILGANRHPSFDERCRQAVRAAFDARLAELETGWRR